MKKSRFFLCFLALALGFSSFADYTGEEAAYTLNRASKRTSWLIRAGHGKTTITEYQPDAPSGPSYLVTLEYEVEIRFYGHEKGTVQFLMPEVVFSPEFYQDLVNNHPVDFGGFKVDYLGMTPASDHQGNVYDQCYLTKIYDIDLGGLDFIETTPATGPKDPMIIVPQKVTGILAQIENLEIKLAINENLPVLGAVQIDITGSSSGVNIRAGFDYTNASMFE